MSRADTKKLTFSLEYAAIPNDLLIRKTAWTSTKHSITKEKAYLPETPICEFLVFLVSARDSGVAVLFLEPYELFKPCIPSILEHFGQYRVAENWGDTSIENKANFS